MVKSLGVIKTSAALVRKWRCSNLLVLFGVLLPLTMGQSASLQAQGQELIPSREYQIKASLIFNFLQYVDWPPESFDDANPTFVLCQLGEDRFGRAFTVIEQEIVQGKRIVTKLIMPEELTNNSVCHVLFINRDTAVPGGMAHLDGRPILTIGETDSFLRNGGVISILNRNNSVVFSINRSTALKRRLTISSKLLRMASEVIE